MRCIACDAQSGCCLAEGGEAVLGQVQLGSAHVLLARLQPAGAGDRGDRGALGEQPDKCHLRRRRVVGGGDLGHQVEQGLVGCPVASVNRESSRECRRPANSAVVSTVPVRQPLPSGLNGTRAMPSSSSVGSDLGSDLGSDVTRPQRVLALQRGHRLDGVCAADGAGTSLGEPLRKINEGRDHQAGEGCLTER